MTEREIINYTLNAFKGRLGSVSALPNNQVNITAVTIGKIVAQFARGAATDIDNRLMVDTAVGENLDRLGAPFGIFRREPKSAQGALKVSGADGEIITGSITRCDGFTYTVLGPAVPPSDDCVSVLVCEKDACPSEGLDTCATGDAVVEDGCAWVWVEASESGVIGNYPAGTELEDASDSLSVVVGPAGITGGCDLECDDDLRRRIILADPRRPTANSPCDIRDRILTAPGVTRVWFQECCGLAQYCFAMDGCYDNSQPQADDVSAVEEYMSDPCFAPLSNIKIKPICAQSLDINLRCVGGELCDISSIQDGLRSWLLQSAEIGVEVPAFEVETIIRALCPGFKFTMLNDSFVPKSNGVFTTATVTLV